VALSAWGCGGLGNSFPWSPMAAFRTDAVGVSGLVEMATPEFASLVAGKFPA
jgi:hypothetical protein